MSQLKVYPERFRAGDTRELMAHRTNLDLTGYTVTLHLKRPDASVVIKPAIILDAANGLFKFTFDATDLVAGECQLAEVQFVVGADVTSSEQFTLNVDEQLA